MAHSTYRSTPQTTNAARVSRVIMGPCTDLFREALRHHISESDFPLKLASYKNSVKPRLKGPQRDMLYPSNALCTAKYKDFDMSLLYLLIRNMCGIPAHGKGWGNQPASTDRTLSANLDRIREIRNTYCGHSPLVCLSDSEFLQVWSDIRQAVLETEFQIMGSSTNYTREIDILKTETMDPEQEKMYLDIIDEQKKELATIICEQQKLGQIQSEQGNVQSKQEERLANQEADLAEQKNVQIKHSDTLAEHKKLLVKQFDTQNKQELTTHEHGNVLASHQGTLWKHELTLLNHGDTLSQHQISLNIQSDTLDEHKSHLLKHDKIHSQQQRTMNEHKEALVKHAEVQSKIKEALDLKLHQLDSEAQNIIVNTRTLIAWHRQSPTYTETESVKNALKILRQKHIIVITGIAGVGKTTLCLELLSRLSLESERTPIKLERPEQWDKVVNADKKMTTFLDDIFGETNFDINRFNSWKKIFDKIISSAKHGKIFIVIGLREHILEQSRLEYLDTELLNKEYELNLSALANKMTRREKKKMISKYEIAFFNKDTDGCDELTDKSTLTYFNIDEIVNYDPYIGFPQACELFFKKREFFELGLEFFKHPTQTLFRDIEKMRKSSDHRVQVGYCVLAYIVINQDIDTNIIKYELFDDIRKLIKLTEYIEQDILDSVVELKGPYLSKTVKNSTYRFSHETVFEAVLLSFGQLSHEIIIQVCGKNTINEVIKTVHYNERPGETVLKVPKRHYPILVEKLFSINTDGEDFRPLGFLAHSATDDPHFADVVFSSNPGESKRKMYMKVVNTVARFDKPGIVQAILKHSSLKNEDNGNDNACHMTERSRCGTFIIKRSDISHLLDTSIQYDQRGIALMLCRYINGLDHPQEYYLRDVILEIDYDDDYDDGFRERYNTFYHCVLKGWHDVTDVILTHHEPSEDDILALLCAVVEHASNKGMVILCEYINTLYNASSYYECCFSLDDYSDKFNTLHHCVVRGWQDVVELIIPFHNTTKTDRGWSCLHLAAFYGRCNLIKYFVNLGQEVMERTQEGYSALQTLMLGLRNRGGIWPMNYLDVKNTYLHELRESSSDEESYFESLQYLLSQDLSLFQDLNFALDEDENNIVYYLVIHNLQKIFDLIIDKGAVISHNKTDIPTALHAALFLGRYNMITKLWTQFAPEQTGCERSLLQTLLLGLRYKTDDTIRYTDVEEANWFSNRRTFTSDEQYTKSFQFLLSKYPDVDEAVTSPLDKHGHTIIYFLVVNNHEMILDILLQSESFVHKCDKEDLQIALRLAVCLGRPTFMKKLWNVTEQVNAIEEISILEPLFRSLQYCFNRRSLYIESNFSKNTNNYKEILEYILTKRPSIVAQMDFTLDDDGNNIIHYLVINDLDTIFDVLLQKCSSKIFLHRNNTKLPTTLHVAVYLGRFNFIEKLWQRGVRPLPKDISLYDAFQDGRRFSGLSLKYIYVERLISFDVTGNSSKVDSKLDFDNLFTELNEPDVLDFPFKLTNKKFDSRYKWIYEFEDDENSAYEYDTKLVVATNSHVHWGDADDFYDTERVLQNLQGQIQEFLKQGFHH